MPKRKKKAARVKAAKSRKRGKPTKSVKTKKSAKPIKPLAQGPTEGTLANVTEIVRVEVAHRLIPVEITAARSDIPTLQCDANQITKLQTYQPEPYGNDRYLVVRAEFRRVGYDYYANFFQPDDEIYVSLWSGSMDSTFYISHPPIGSALLKRFPGEPPGKNGMYCQWFRTLWNGAEITWQPRPLTLDTIGFGLNFMISRKGQLYRVQFVGNPSHLPAVWITWGPLEFGSRIVTGWRPHPWNLA